LEDIMMVATGRSASGWLIDVWNCHGVLKPCGFEGYGNQDPKILEFLNEQRSGMTHRWEAIGWFTIPVPGNAMLSKRQKERIDNILAAEVERNGMINQSGFYPVSAKTLEKLERPGMMDRYWVLWDWIQAPTERREVLVCNPHLLYSDAWKGCTWDGSGTYVYGVEIARRTGEEWKPIKRHKLPPQSIIEAAPRVRITT
jgi:hypothetical protein